MDLANRISKLGKYFAGMEITTLEGKQIIYVGVNFPEGWIIDETINEKYNVSVINGTDGNTYFACDINDGIENVFDAIDYNISKMKDAIERAKLLSEKTKDLKSLFEDENNTVETLRNLKFVFFENKQEEEPIIPIKKKSGKTKQNNENNQKV